MNVYDGQLEMNFNVLNGEDLGFKVAERRVVVTPDESLTDETQPPKKTPLEVYEPVKSADSLGFCRRCRKGELYLYTYTKGKNDLPGETAVRCTYCE